MNRQPGIPGLQAGEDVKVRHFTTVSVRFADTEAVKPALPR